MGAKPAVPGRRGSPDEELARICGVPVGTVADRRAELHADRGKPWSNLETSVQHGAIRLGLLGVLGLPLRCGGLDIRVV